MVLSNGIDYTYTLTLWDTKIIIIKKLECNDEQGNACNVNN